MDKRTSELGRLKNIGPKTERWLSEAGFFTEAELREAGAVLAYRIVKHQHSAVNLLLFYALDGALRDVHWNALSPERKAQLQREAGGALSVTAGKSTRPPSPLLD